MGNPCCTGRRIDKLTRFTVPSQEPRLKNTKKPDNKFPVNSYSKNIKKNASGRPSIDAEYVGNSVLDSKMPENLDIKDSLIEELEYNLIEAHQLTQKDQNNILHVFELYQNEIPSTEKEQFEGFLPVTINESSAFSSEKVLVVSNFAIYVLKKSDISYVQRRIRLENIQIILLESNLNSLIIHSVNNNLLGDLWITSSQIEDIHNCIQTMFNFLLNRYIPTFTYASNVFESKFNNIPKVFVLNLLEEENLKITNAVIREGKIGENVVYNKKTQWISDNKVSDCIAVLTTKALYSFNMDYKLLLRLEIKLISSITVNETLDILIIHKNDFEEIVWFLNSKFVTEIEKAAAEVRQERLAIYKSHININEYVKPSIHKLKRM
jgi:predicted XRE-type DNA-binding protein